MHVKRDWPELLTGLGIVFVGLVIGYQASLIKVIPLYAKVGPAAFLWFAASLLVLCGITVAYFAWSKSSSSEGELKGPLLIVTGLLVAVFALEPLGFIPTATLVFTMTAKGVGSRRLVRDVAVGLFLAIAAFATFGWGLGLRLPVGNLLS